MRYPHTYSLLVVLSIFAAFALSACERASLRPYPEEAALADIPSTIIDILPEDERLLAPEGMQENRDKPEPEDEADNRIEESLAGDENTENMISLCNYHLKSIMPLANNSIEFLKRPNKLVFDFTREQLADL